MNPIGSILSDTHHGTEKVPDEDEISRPMATMKEVLECQFSSWYPSFSNLRGVGRPNATIKSLIIRDLPTQFEEFLLSDGIKLPSGAEKLSSTTSSNAEWSSEEGEEDSAVEEEEIQCNLGYSFPHLNKLLKDGIQSLGGKVFPKLNWSAPKDASWVSGGSLACETPGDVYLLIKSSDFCLHDVLRKSWMDCRDREGILGDTPPLQLVLRKWCHLLPSMEFRCFVREHKLIAISQRDHTQYYAHLLQNQSRIREMLLFFFENIVVQRFANGDIENYVFDVYIDRKDRVWLLDFNVWARSTDALLFNWSELLTMGAEDAPVFRAVKTSNQVRQNPLASYRAPVDTLELASLTGGRSMDFEDFMKKCQSPTHRGLKEADKGVEQLDGSD